MVVASGAPASGPRSTCTSWKRVTGADEVRRAVRLQLRRGATATKFFATGLLGSEWGGHDAQLTLDELRAGVDETHRHGRHAFAHAHGVQGIKNAVGAGVASIDHG